MKAWTKEFDERDLKEIQFAIVYLTQFQHGTDGHNRLKIIARLAGLLEKYYKDSEEDAVIVQGTERRTSKPSAAGSSPANRSTQIDFVDYEKKLVEDWELSKSTLPFNIWLVKILYETEQKRDEYGWIIFHNNK